jgi:GNAT superfamily N-acetyltransferase
MRWRNYNHRIKRGTLVASRPEIRAAGRGDVAAIARMFASDTLGGHGDSADPADLPLYMVAFERIEASPNDALYVAELNGEIVGTFQVTFTTTMTGRGSLLMRLEAVHTREDLRGRGIGEAMVRHAIKLARDGGASKMVLSSNKKRARAHSFYERLGFERSHEGFRMKP